MKTVIALGSNIGDRLRFLQRARDALLLLHESSQPAGCSKIYETAPVGCAPGAPSFLNAVVEMEFSGNPGALLAALRGIEAELGRALDSPPNAPRVIDLDIVFFGDLRIHKPSLVIPHPRAHERRFVLQPLSDLNPARIFPGHHETVARLLEKLPASAAVEVFAETW